MLSLCKSVNLNLFQVKNDKKIITMCLLILDDNTVYKIVLTKRNQIWISSIHAQLKIYRKYRGQKTKLNSVMGCSRQEPECGKIFKTNSQSLQPIYCKNFKNRGKKWGQEKKRGLGRRRWLKKRWREVKREKKEKID